MKFKGLIIWVAGILTLLSGYHIYMTWQTQRIEKEARRAATDPLGNIDFQKQEEYLRKKSSETVFSFLKNDYTYKDTKKRSIRSGIDISGGTLIVVTVDEQGFLAKMMVNPKSQLFVKACKLAKKKLGKNVQKSFSDHFCDAVQEIQPGTQLSSLFLGKYISEIGIDPTNDQIQSFLNKRYQKEERQAKKVIDARLNKTSVEGILVTSRKDKGIEIQLPGTSDAQKTKQMLSKQGDLRFQVVVEDTKLLESFIQGVYLLLQSKLKLYGPDGKQLAITDLFTVSHGIVYCNTSYIQAVMQLLNHEEVQMLLPSKIEVCLGSQEEQGYVPLYFLNKAHLTINILSAQVQYENGSYITVLRMDYPSSKSFARWTGNNINKMLAIVIDGRVNMAPKINQKITEGKCSIEGKFTAEQAQVLAQILSSGILPKLAFIEESFIGPDVAEEAQQKSMLALQFALLLVLLFMLLYYALGGLVANMALLFNTLFVLGTLAQLGASLTLPGIAGIVLTIGMAIDANVIIFEAIREELRKGVHILVAIQKGYDKAYRSIIDSNVTTLLTGVILYWFGTGSIKGFATTLIIGIISSVFTSVFLTRLMIEGIARIVNPERISFSLPFTGNLLTRVNFNFLGRRKIAYLLSILFISTGFFFIYQQGMNLAVDFTGGLVSVVKFHKPVSIPHIKEGLNKTFPGKSTEVKTYGSSNIIRTTTNAGLQENSLAADKRIKQQLIQGLSATTGCQFIENNMKLTSGTFTIANTSKIGASAADDIKSGSWWAVLMALLLILVYIFLSFRNMSLALASIVALLHDILTLFAAFGIAKACGVIYEVDQIFISCVLTIVGYSINDTVVIFSFLRMFLSKSQTTGLHQVANPAINSTLSRTLITSLTTMIPIFILYFKGGKALESMAFSLMVGVISGTYSSVFIATPLAHDFMILGDKIKRLLIRKK
ncbi:MAG: protein translocase subunit SecD [Bacteroidota bacterium]